MQGSPSARAQRPEKPRHAHCRLRRRGRHVRRDDPRRLGAGQTHHRKTCSIGSTGSTTRPSRPRSATTRSTSSSSRCAATSTALRADQSRQQKRTEKARRVVADSIVRQYEGDSLSAVGQAVVSSDPNAFVSQLTTMSAFNSMQAGQYSSLPDPGEGAEHPPERHPATSSPRSPSSRSRPPRTRRPSPRTSPRPRACSARCRPTARGRA